MYLVLVAGTEFSMSAGSAPRNDEKGLSPAVAQRSRCGGHFIATARVKQADTTKRSGVNFKTSGKFPPQRERSATIGVRTVRLGRHPFSSLRVVQRSC
jgi:hypothetical protein